jgi:hypothetical protein
MAWPELNRVTCFGFPKSYLPAIAEAMARKEVKWGKSSLFASSGSAEFEWAGCTWQLSENFELVDSVSLLKGKPNIEDLTAAVLVYK